MHKAIATAAIVATVLAGCATGPITPTDFASIIAGAEDAFAAYERIRAAHDTDEDEHQNLEAQAEEAWATYERWRNRLGSLGLKSRRELPRGPMPPLHP